MRIRLRLSVVALAVALAAIWPGGSVFAAKTFGCDKAGGSQALVDACGARWSAANLRVHIVAQRYGNSNRSCLERVATALDALAVRLTASGKAGSYTLPCGELPAVATAEDGLLADACPRAVWSYANRGEPDCDTSLARLRARYAAAARNAIRSATPTPAGASALKTADDYAAELARLLTVNVSTTNHKGETKRFVNSFQVSDCAFRYESDFTASWGDHYEFVAQDDISDIDPLVLIIGIDDPADTPKIYGVHVQTVGTKYSIKTNGIQGTHGGDFFKNVHTLQAILLDVGPDIGKARTAIRDLAALIRLCPLR